MALTKEKNMAIAAMNAKGMCIEAIARKAGVSKDEVRESLENRGRSYIEIGIMTKEEKEGWIRELQSGGKSIAEIMELTGLGKATVYTYIFYKGKDEAKKAEKPAAKAEPKEGRSYNTHTVKDKETVIRLYKEGRMQKDIAKETGVSKSTVCKWIADFKKEQLGEQPEPEKKTQINEEFEKAVDEMIEESKADTEKQAYEEAAVEVESEPIKTENEKREKAGIEPIAEPEVKQVGADMKILNICEEALKAAEKDMLSIYNRLSEAEQHAWDLGEVYANLMRARGEFV